MSEPKHRFDPCLLIAMPQMQDPNFKNTVSLLSEFNENGAVALILNRPLQMTIFDILSDDFKKQLESDPILLAALQKHFVYWGGPVDIQQGLILHNSPEFRDKSVPIGPQAFITGSVDVLKDLLLKDSQHSNVFIRFFLGYAGWGSNQLEDEIAESCWITSALEPFVFETKAEDLWKKVVQKLGIELSQLTSVPYQDEFH